LEFKGIVFLLIFGAYPCINPNFFAV